MPINDSTAPIIEVLDSAPKGTVATVEPTIIMIKDTIINTVDQTVSGSIPSMNSNFDINISPFLVLAFIGFGIGLFFLIAFLRKYILPVFIQRYSQRKISLFWYRLTTIVWLLFGLFWLYQFLSASILITAVFIIILGTVFNQFLRDFIIGIYYQFENQIKIKDHLNTSTIEGEVQAFLARHLKVITVTGEEIYIPYRSLLQTPIRIIKEVDSLLENQFTVVLEGDSLKNIVLLRSYMTMCPWIYDPSLYSIVHLSNDQYRISVRVKENFTATKIESFIKSKIK